jgi:catenin alpha
VRHPELPAAKANRDYVYKQVCDAVNLIEGVAQATGTSEAHPYEGVGELAAALEEFDVSSNCKTYFIKSVWKIIFITQRQP